MFLFEDTDIAGFVPFFDYAVFGDDSGVSINKTC